MKGLFSKKSVTFSLHYINNRILVFCPQSAALRGVPPSRYKRTPFHSREAYRIAGIPAGRQEKAEEKPSAVTIIELNRDRCKAARGVPLNNDSPRFRDTRKDEREELARTSEKGTSARKKNKRKKNKKKNRNVQNTFLIHYRATRTGASSRPSDRP